MSIYRQFWACLLLSSLLFLTIVFSLKAFPDLGIPDYARAAAIALVGGALLIAAVKEEGRKVAAIAALLALLFFSYARTDQYAPTFVLSLGMASALVYGCAREKRGFGGTLMKLGIVRQRLVPETLFAIALTFGIYSLMFFMFLIYKSLGIADAQNVIDIVEYLPQRVLLLAVLVNPISEELFFRGLLAPRIGIVGSAVIFALFHLAYGSVMELFNVFIIGVIFAAVYLSRRSLIAPMLSHAIINSTAIILMRFGT
ncbi:MAG: CPBP family intramembrane metalloprotease [Candidatus Burarchaeum sp.]|nr:CPBP family intramembrane glutamic endopeptidase [Candidatus Burarchaeum sp.]MDO8339116.1 CPBP family intramembrane metalloprotease [Candidatus Burarchaeum sp.]